MTDVSHYLGLLDDKSSLSHWGTITWVSGLEPETALDILGGNADSELSLSFEDCHSAAAKDFRLRGYFGSEILLDKAGPWLLCIEPFGDGGSMTDTLLALSKKGTAFSLLSHPSGFHTFSYAADGEALVVIRRIGEPWVEGPISLEEIVGDLPLLDGDSEPVTWAANALALAEGRTGFRLTAEWLDAEHPCFVGTPRPGAPA
ncbi:DUF6461 domain-containing protein [Herbidospora yilanensis]|uniref:DUF6461 domain-containing protein n=1 Tax=Herbidospora yilanensis TaxID=354426 RepID=UPI0007858671|nr:DUF6461 domain-containing protein [Herbidospora yilanensis]